MVSHEVIEAGGIEAGGHRSRRPSKQAAAEADARQRRPRSAAFSPPLRVQRADGGAGRPAGARALENAKPKHNQ
jgi:hypothetical protein